MTSTYSTSLRLELMATGDQSGTWGTTTNTNLGTLLEQAITGVLSVAEGDTTLTLSTVNGGSDQARNAVVNLTGAMTAARNVVVPTANKVYLVKNSTTGGYAVTVKTAAGTGVAIPPGTARWVYCDGTNVVDGLSGPWTPSTNDGAALGLAAVSWSDLFLASGAVINFNNGNYTLTHSTGLLTASGALSIGTSNTFTTGTIELGNTSDTTLARSAAGAMTVEGVPVFLVPSGTKMLFVQTSAPTGWTKDTDQNDKALRIVSGTASTGGSSAFSTVFGKTATDAHTLTISEMPVHSHGVTDPGHAHSARAATSGDNATLWHRNASDQLVASGDGAWDTTLNTTIEGATTGISIQNAGNGNSHTHGMDIRVQYVDVIKATKD